MFQKEQISDVFMERRGIMKKNDIAALKKSSLFSDADDALISELLESGNYEKTAFKKGETVFSPCNTDVRLALVLKGFLEVSKDTGKGKLFMNRLETGAISGMSCLFGDASSFPTTVTAGDNVRILFITREQLMSLFGRYPGILEKYLSLLCRKICFLGEKIESITAPDAAEALRGYFLDIAGRLGTDTFTLPVPAQKLAATLGIGRTSLYRAFDQLTAEGFLIKNGKTITIERK